MEIDFTKWKMRNGTEISVDKMGISHIKNCINMLKSQTIPYYEELLGSLAEQEDCSLDIMACIETIEWLKQYVKVFVNELNRRGVEMKSRIK